MTSVISAHWLNDTKKVVFSFIGIIVQVYLTMILISYSPNDPSWSHVNTEVSSFANMGGARGAWLSDLLFTFFGRAAWLLVAYILYEVILLWWYRRIIFGGLRAIGYVLLILVFSSFLAMKATIGQGVLDTSTGNLMIPMSLADNMLAGGGIIGYEMSVRLQLWMSKVWTWLFLLLFLVATTTLAFDIRWKSLLVNLFDLSWFGSGLSVDNDKERQTLEGEEDVDLSDVTTIDNEYIEDLDRDNTIIDLLTGKPHPRYQPFDEGVEEIDRETDDVAVSENNTSETIKTPFAAHKKGSNELEDFLLQSGLATEPDKKVLSEDNAIEELVVDDLDNIEAQTAEQNALHTPITQPVIEIPVEVESVSQEASVIEETSLQETAESTKPSNPFYPFGNKGDKDSSKQGVVKEKVEPTFDWNNPQTVERLLSDNPVSPIHNEVAQADTQVDQTPKAISITQPLANNTSTDANYREELGLNFDYSDGSDIFSTIANSVANIQSEDFIEDTNYENGSLESPEMDTVSDISQHQVRNEVKPYLSHEHEEKHRSQQFHLNTPPDDYLADNYVADNDVTNYEDSEEIESSDNLYKVDDAEQNKRYSTPDNNEYQQVQVSTTDQQHQKYEQRTESNYQYLTDGFVTPTKDDDPFIETRVSSHEYTEQDYDNNTNPTVNDNTDNDYFESLATEPKEREATPELTQTQIAQKASTQSTQTSVLPDIHDDEAFVGKSRAFQTAKHRQNLSAIPPLDILDIPDPNRRPSYTRFELEQLSELLEIKLQDFNVKAEVVNAIPGPVVTRFEVELAPGVKASKVVNISRDLARSLSMASLRVVEVIPGKPYIGIEVPNKKREMVRLIELLDTDKYRDPNGQISMAMGKDIGGKPIITDLAKAPHMLVAGTTGSGKSVLVNSMLLSMLLKYKPDDLRLILIDPKQLELANYNDIPHLLTPVVTDMTEAAGALSWCVQEMERRYQLMSLLRVRKLKEFNKKVLEAAESDHPIIDPLWRPNDSVSIDKAPKLKPLPMIVIVADEFADMMMQVGKQAEELITRLAQKSRAAGIHLMLATQRPSVDVITGLIKANVPVRAALRVNSKVDSRTILDSGGAEDMLGNGDMLFLGPGQIEPDRVHGAFVSDEEVNRVCEAWRERGAPDYIDNFTENFQLTSSDSGSGTTGGTSGEDDAFYNEAVAFILETRKVSASSIQRKFSIGYNRAARIVDSMEEAGIVGPMIKGKREILV